MTIPTADRDHRPEEEITDGVQTVRLIISWLVVGIPLLWGIAQVVIKSLALFLS